MKDKQRLEKYSERFDNDKSAIGNPNTWGKRLIEKQETLDEAAKNHAKKMWGVYYDDIHPDIAITQTQGEITKTDFIAGANWQQERSYSEKEVDCLILLLKSTTEYEVLQCFRDKVEQFKNK